MEAALESLKKLPDSSKIAPALNLMKVYFNNIAKEPGNPKYRRIRVGNAKFNTTLWQLEEARTFLLLAGFEQDGDFLVLPEQMSIDAAKLLIENYTSNCGQPIATCIQPAIASQPSTSNETRGTLQGTQPKAALKLITPKGASYFDQEIKADLTLLSYMIEMGYKESAAEKALIATKNLGVQPAMDWISLNPQVLVNNEQKKNMTAVAEQSSSSNQNGQSSGLPSSTTGMTTAPDARPVPTSRYQKTADERHKFQEKLRLEAMEAARIEKLAEKQHKQSLLREMQSDKEEKKEKKEQNKKLKTLAQSSEGLCSTQSSGSRDMEQIPGTSTEKEIRAELRIRLPDGQVNLLSLLYTANIKQIYQHVCRSTGLSEDEFILLTSYPQKELTDMVVTIEYAGLTPRAALVVQRKDQHGMVTEGHDKVCTVKAVLSLDDWQSVLSKTTDTLLVAEFCASWCANSRSIADRYESLNAEYAVNQSVLFVRVDIEQLKVLKYQLRISTLPTFKLFWNEKQIAEQQGSDMDALEELIKNKRQGPNDEEMGEDPR